MKSFDNHMIKEYSMYRSLIVEYSGRIMESSPIITRSRKRAVKQDQITDALRARIVTGDLKGGAKLPTRKELETEFGASLQTIQRALDRLSDEGFVYTRGSLGTLVADSPPHLCHYGLAVPGYPTSCDPEELALPRYWTAMINEARSLEHQGDRRCTVYYGINGHTDSEDFQRLTRDVVAHRLAEHAAQGAARDARRADVHV